MILAKIVENSTKRGLVQQFAILHSPLKEILYFTKDELSQMEVGSTQVLLAT